MRSFKSSVVIAVSFAASVVSFASLAQASEQVTGPFEVPIVSDMSLYTSLNYGHSIAPKVEPVFDFALSAPKTYEHNEIAMSDELKNDLKVSMLKMVKSNFEVSEASQ